ncbi:MAG: FKBP-type peptidyl-prolyl cis-trans isomerase [Tepidisphaera sp.]|jgi:peptidylprolyl isomerase
MSSIRTSPVLVSMVLGLGAASMLAFQPGSTPPATPTPETKPAQPAETKPATKPEIKNVKTPDGKEYQVQKTSEVKLLIEDLVIGEGAEARASSTITLNYHGTLAKNGTKFDGNWGEAPITFPLDNLIDGWKIGIPGMKVGGIRQLTIPWQLAYGERASGPIPAKADLVFLIELKGVK